MKVTKVNKMRTAVSGKKIAKEGRGILYPAPNVKNKVNSVEKEIEDRVKNANNLYNVFFKSDIPYKLEKHFSEIVKLTAKSNDDIEFIKKAEKYQGYGRRDNNTYLEEIKNFKYGPSKKSINKTMKTHVMERMHEIWQQDKYSYAAVAILGCICNENYSKEIKKVSPEIMSAFREVSQICSKSYIDQNTEELENCFTNLMQRMAIYCRGEKIEDKVKWLEKQNFVILNKGKKHEKEINLQELKFEYATEDRMNAVLVRMRKSIKRGTNGVVAVKLLQGLAQKDNKSLSIVLQEMMENDKEKEALEKFLQAVEDDYYKAGTVKAIKNHDVKVQVYDSNVESSDQKIEREVQVRNKRLDLSSLNIEKMSVKKKYKAALTETLEKYASSKEASDRVLLDIKGIFFEFFMWKDVQAREEFVTEQKLWNIPRRIEEYFDQNFESIDEKKTEKREDNEETSFDLNFEVTDKKESKKKEDNEELSIIWSRSKNASVKKRINYVNCGKYQQLMKEEEDEFRKYWITYAKDYVEKNYVKKKNLQKDDCYNTTMLFGCWKSAIRFLCGKYIDLGKAVYHFAMPEEMSSKSNLRYGVLKDEYVNGISSFDYEFIKAEEDIQREIANATVAAASAFSRSVMNVEKQAAEDGKEDVMFLKEAELPKYMKDEEIIKTQLLRFYGGRSTIKGIDEYKQVGVNGNLLAKELLSHLKRIRNENFHFTKGKKVKLFTKCTEILWENEKEVYQQIVKEKYYFNNAALFYGEKELAKLVAKLYEKNIVSEAQIPAFRNVWKKKDLPEYIEDLSISWYQGMNKDKRVIFQGALYFLLKEIYYRDFVVSEKAGELFFGAVQKYVEEIEEKKKTLEKQITDIKELQSKDEKKSSDKNTNTLYKKDKNKTVNLQWEKLKDLEQKLKETNALFNAGKNFKIYVMNVKESHNVYRGILKNGDDSYKLTFGNVCQFINGEYNQQNRNGQDEEIYKHFKMLLLICVQRAFQQYIDDNYGFLKNPEDKKSGTFDYLDNIKIACMEIDKEQAHWFTFAHFIHPKQLNLLIGNFKDYIQFKKDVVRRAEYAGQLTDENEKKIKTDELKKCVNKAERILNVLEFVRHTSGRVSQNFEDYYADEEEYARYMSAYIDFKVENSDKVFESLKTFCQKTLPNGKVIDIYADAANPKILRNVEIARMYAGGNLVLPGYERITVKEIEKYYKEKDEIADIQSKGICQSQEDQKKVVDFQQLKGRITLNEVTDLFSMVNDMLGQLISLAYLRERDQMYLFLGFYYMALRNADGWKDEILEQVKQEEGEKYFVEQGLVLYQTVAVFDFGTKLLCLKDGKWSDETGAKWVKFINSHWETYHCIIRLFGNYKYIEKINNLRNYVDHSKYYVKYDKSILELYSQFYTQFFGYSTKLQKSVLFNLENILEKYFVNGKLRFDGRENVALDKETKSLEFTYKYKECDKETNKEMLKTMQLPAKSETFMKGMHVLLQYKSRQGI
mgnify:CR=1 FL=1